MTEDQKKMTAAVAKIARTLDPLTPEQQRRVVEAIRLLVAEDAK